MILRNTITFVAAFGLALPAMAQDRARAAENPKAVLPAVRRVEVLRSASALLENAPADSEKLVAGLVDPFSADRALPTEQKPTTPTAPVEVVPSAEMLARVASKIAPTGTMLIGSEHYLLLDGRRVKTGDVISVNLDGLTVTVTVTLIQRNSYTLRLKDQELRRDFK